MMLLSICVAGSWLKVPSDEKCSRGDCCNAEELKGVRYLQVQHDLAPHLVCLAMPVFGRVQMEKGLRSITRTSG